MGNGPGGSIIRNHTLYRITSDAFTGSGRLVVNSDCIDIDPGSTGAHPDFHQSYSPAPNWCQDVILYNVRGLKGLSQGLFGHRLRNTAFVNLLFDGTINDVLLCGVTGALRRYIEARGGQTSGLNIRAFRPGAPQYQRR